MLERSLKVLCNSGENEIIERDYDEDNYRYPQRISMALRKNKNFRDDFNKATEEFNDWYFQQCKFSNLIEISSKEQKLTIKQNLNKKEWDKLFASAFSNIIRKNVEFLIIHISSNISNDEKTKIADDVNQLFFNIPIKKYYSNRNNKSTLVEIFFFGSAVEQYSFEE